MSRHERDPSVGGSPRVSVISLVYKNAPLLLDAFPTLEQQSLRDFEQILMLNGTEDDSGERIAREWCAGRSFTRLVRSETNLGICRGLNTAIREARGEYLAFFTDDRWAPSHLQSAVAALDEAGPRAAVFFCPTVVVDSDLRLVSRLDPVGTLAARSAPHLGRLFDAGPPRLIEGRQMLEVLLTANVVSAVAVVIRRSVFEKLGGYDESLPFEDYEFSLRASLDHDWVFSPETTATYVEHKKSFSSQQAAVVSRGGALSIERHKRAFDARDLGRQAAHAAFGYWIRAAYAFSETGKHAEAKSALRQAYAWRRRLAPRQLATLLLAGFRLNFRNSVPRN